MLARFFESATFANTFAYGQVAVASIGFVGLIIGAAFGGGIGGCSIGLAICHGNVSTWLKFLKLILITVFWLVAFAVGFYVALLDVYILGQLLRLALEPVFGQWVGIVLGWSLGGAIGGLVAGSIGNLGLVMVYKQ